MLKSRGGPRLIIRPMRQPMADRPPLPRFACQKNAEDSRVIANYSRRFFYAEIAWLTITFFVVIDGQAGAVRHAGQC